MTTTSSRVVLITGASRGLGRSMALHLARRGLSVIGTYRSHEAEAVEVAREIEAAGATAAMLQLDVSETGAFEAFGERLRATLVERFGTDQLYGLVNNAGIGFNKPFAETTEDDFDRIFSVQVRGPYFLTQRLLPFIADGGRILFISSGLTRFVGPGYSAYASTKGAVEVLSRYLAVELAARAIRVNTVAPGVIETDFAGGVTRDNPEINARLATTIALGRVGLPDDVGAAVAAVLSPDFHWVTGERIEVSGGQRL